GKAIVGDSAEAKPETFVIIVAEEMPQIQIDRTERDVSIDDFSSKAQLGFDFLPCGNTVVCNVRVDFARIGLLGTDILPKRIASADGVLLHFNVDCSAIDVNRLVEFRIAEIGDGYQFGKVGC